MKAKFLLLALFLSFNGFSQFSKTHYIPPLSNTQAYETLDQYLYISCPSITDITYRITAIGGATTTGTVRRDNPQTILIGNGDDTQILANDVKVNTVLNNKGYIVEAQDLVYVTVRLTAAGGNHAGGLVSKGLAALGTQFRIGAFTNTGVATDARHYTFASILATENNTVVSFSDLKPGVSLINNAGAGNTPASITLNSGESFIMAVEGPDPENADGLIGALISSTKPVAVNCGSFGGTNGDAGNSSDIGFDQIVSAERLKSGGLPGAEYSDYIFIRGNGGDLVEKPLIVCHENNTQIFLNGSATPAYTKNAGEYVALSGTDFNAAGNLFVHTSKPAFAYQGIGGTGSQANQNMHFLPPLTCETPKVINNIPFIDQVGNNNNFSGTVCIVTETAATLTFIINGTSYSLATLPGAGITVNGPFAVTGNTAYETYTFEGFSGNVSVFSSKSIYLSYFGTSGAATYGGFYSGFTFKPEVTQQILVAGQLNCIPNANLTVSSITAFDVFQWYFNDVAIPSATTNQYLPTQPGYYNVQASISTCPSPPLISDKTPVSSCPTNGDNDLANDNIDIDLDNDGITNCTESFGNQIINTLVPSGTIPQSTITYAGTVTNTIPAAPTPFLGNVDGSFITEVLAGKTNNVIYNLAFSQPTNIKLEYPTTANASDLLNANAEYVVNSDTNKTVTVLNPTNQLLIDTNYDGIYESGVTQYSSFEIRFRLNGTIPLAAGTGTFSLQSFQTSNFKITHKNLTDSAGNKSTFKLVATCVYKDTDSDGTPDQLDTDSDNDGILDNLEAQVNASVAISNTDTNGNGLDNAFETGFTPIDTDLDGVLDYLDLDSDNDGIRDSDELIADTDADGIKNYRELDSDNDLCNDVIEAGFSGTPDANGDGLLGAIAPPTVNSNGQVTSGVGYTTPTTNYITYAPILITTQPSITPTCNLQNVTITLADNGGNTYQWQVSTNGVTWTNVANAVPYSGATTNTLTITSVPTTLNNYKYRVQLNKVGNSCGLLSADATLTVYPLPVVNDVTMIECDTDLDLLTTFNLELQNPSILSPTTITSEIFTYYTSPASASAGGTAGLITNYSAFNNTSSPMNVWARVTNSKGCFSVAKITLIASASNIPQTYTYIVPPVCDDTLAIDGTVSGNIETNKRDGITAFDFSAAENAPLIGIRAQLPAGTYDIKYYRSQADGLAQIDTNGNSLAILPSEYSNFRNDIANTQDIWVRVINTLGACSGFGPFIKLSVEKLPFANLVPEFRQCDTDADKLDGIFTFINTASLETTLLGNNQTFPVTVTYFDNATNTPLRDSNGILITSPFPSAFATTSKTIKAVVTNNTTQKCYDERLIVFTVDKLPTATLPTTDIRTVCDDEVSPTPQDGIFNFITPNLENEIKGSQTNVVITYFNSLGNPLLDILGNPIVSPFPSTFKTTSRTIKAVVTSTIAGTSCPAATIDIEFKVNKIPNINLVDTGVICANLSTLYITLDAGINDGTSPANYTYEWFKDNVKIIGESHYTLTDNDPRGINQAGIYTVVVRTIPEGCPSTRTITVVASNSATLLSPTIIDLADNNTVTVNVTGSGDYVYSIDEEFGPFQDSNVFTNVSAGIHTIYVKDLNGCGTVPQEINVLGVPKYFTPNGDGIHDYWNVGGVTATFNAKTIVYIFDRFGKLIKQISPLDKGWDGTYNGTALPATDYWYTVEFENGKNVKGNFALKR
ncbi:gliding motility-associated C-terminal domain-containing protein [Flavobacterium swingsii]|uniref:Gliding motility-associated C-terminal domain-containing protein n=1 Tax=Flavobacterium swingsii TaxID=498292 RepID=A0A1I0V3A0_9FLAO|nr:T9SS type B sorting domain-containing protein [Flavobacterium swingsii]SFA70517.1 gliding motility-associated C-terminal domain-containing protein [Flavobacterium swingsii]